MLPRRGTGLDDLKKAVISAACERFIAEVLKPQFLPVVRPTQFNYVVDILGKWHGTKYRFIQRYRSGFPDSLGQEFEQPFTRLEYAGRDRFHLSYLRHTEQWFRLYSSLTLAEALKEIEDTGLLHPL